MRERRRKCGFQGRCATVLPTALRLGHRCVQFSHELRRLHLLQRHGDYICPGCIRYDVPSGGRLVVLTAMRRREGVDGRVGVLRRERHSEGDDGRRRGYLLQVTKFVRQPVYIRGAREHRTSLGCILYSVQNASQ